MEVLLSNFKRSSSSCKGSRADGITDAVLKKTIFQSLMKRFVIVVLFMLSGLGFAQSDTYMYWDKAVGCAEFEYSGNPPKYEFNEDIEDAPCIRACEYST